MLHIKVKITGPQLAKKFPAFFYSIHETPPPSSYREPRPFKNFLNLLRITVTRY